jgi:two-component system sensor histidine kinase DesK
MVTFQDLPGCLGSTGVEDQGRVTRWRKYGAFFGLVWLFLLVADAGAELTGPHPPTLKAAIMVAAGLFVGLYSIYWLSVARVGEPRAPLPILLGLCALAAGISIVSFQNWSGLFIYCAIAAGFGFAWRRAIVGVVAVTALAAAVGAITGADPIWFAIVLPVTFLTGLGMISINQMVNSYREVRMAREETARLAVTEERLRFARDLHDLLGHSLSVIVLKSELAGRLMEASPERAAAELRDIERVAREALREVREAVGGYRKPGLGQEVDGAREALAAAGIEVTLDRRAPTLPPPVEGVLAWAVREGCTNVLRHSHARRVRVSLETQDGAALLEMVDDGGGSLGESGGSGLRGLRERVEARGGRVDFGTRAGGGFRLAVRVPLDAPPNQAGP